MPPALALTVNGPPARFGAVYSPLLFRVPRPVSVQVKTGCVFNAAANWSRAVAENCNCFRTPTVAVPGLTTIEVSVWLTVTLTLLVTLRPAASVIVTGQV